MGVMYTQKRMTDHEFNNDEKMMRKKDIGDTWLNSLANALTPHLVAVKVHWLAR